MILRFCNRVREVLGKEPVDELVNGIPEDADNDVLARTIGDVTVDGLAVMQLPDNEFGLRELVLPVYIITFLVDFDAGHYPDLIDSGDPET